MKLRLLARRFALLLATVQVLLGWASSANAVGF